MWWISTNLCFNAKMSFKMEVWMMSLLVVFRIIHSQPGRMVSSCVNLLRLTSGVKARTSPCPGVEICLAWLW